MFICAVIKGLQQVYCIEFATLLHTDTTQLLYRTHLIMSHTQVCQFTTIVKLTKRPCITNQAVIYRQARQNRTIHPRQCFQTINKTFNSYFSQVDKLYMTEHQ